VFDVAKQLLLFVSCTCSIYWCIQVFRHRKVCYAAIKLAPTELYFHASSTFNSVAPTFSRNFMSRASNRDLPDVTTRPLDFQVDAAVCDAKTATRRIIKSSVLWHLILCRSYGRGVPVGRSKRDYKKNSLAVSDSCMKFSLTRGEGMQQVLTIFSAALWES